MFINSIRLGAKTVLITGAGGGIGFQTTLHLARKDYRIIMADKQDLRPTRKQIIASTGNQNITMKYLDLASFACIRCFASDFLKSETRLDVLLNNAGIFTGGQAKTVDGLLPTVQVNHFGPFLLTHLLLDLLKKSAPSRIIFVSSIGAFFHRLAIENLCSPQTFPVSPLFLYYNSKLYNIVAANGFAQRLKDFGVTSNSLHPGMTNSPFLGLGENFKTIMKLFTNDEQTGAQTSIFLASSDAVVKSTGKFFIDLREHQQPRVIDDANFCNHVWEYSEFYTGLN